MTADLTLYHEVRGAGPVILLIPPTPGDGGMFQALAAALESCSVVTYDRRGTSRTPKPAEWLTTTVAEQADDAGEVLRAVTSEPAVVYGTSNGAMVALELALRHPERVSTALLHEMPLLSVLGDPEPIGRILGDLISAGMQRGGPVGALDAFLRFAYGDDLVDKLDPTLRARMDANAEMVLAVELPGFQAYRPDDEVLAALDVPVRILVGEDQRLPLFHEAATWLADRVGASVLTAPGGHGAHWSHPLQLASFIVQHASGD